MYNILIVDDERIERNGIIMLLKRLSINAGIVEAANGKEAYEDLFALRKDAQQLSLDEVKGKLKTLTQGQKSDNIINLMANTFKALCELADWSVLTGTSPQETYTILCAVNYPI